jgi:hypothetical protein
MYITAITLTVILSLVMFVWFAIILGNEWDSSDWMLFGFGVVMIAAITFLLEYSLGRPL